MKEPVVDPSTLRPLVEETKTRGLLRTAARVIESAQLDAHPHFERAPTENRPGTSRYSHAEVGGVPGKAEAVLQEVLAKHEFLKQLRREKRRSDRSKASLSIVLFSVEPSTEAVHAFRVLLQCLRRSIRETDTLGDLGDGCAAVLLPDTHEQGTKCFTNKIADRADGLPFSIITATYPHDLFDRLLNEVPPQGDLNPLLLEDGMQHYRRSLMAKRALDVLGAITALTLLAPLMACVALAVAVTSPGPIVFRQVRLGLKGTPFVFYKFRSMYANSDDLIHRNFVTNLIKGGERKAQGTRQSAGMWSKLKTDPRITPLGAFLRSTSMDELPQLFNVLKGNLSLVGPRPPLIYEVQQYQSWHLRRIMEVKPGISGLWQVESRGGSTFEDMVRMDLRYIREWSLRLDVKILLKTIKVVIVRSGAG